MMNEEKHYRGHTLLLAFWCFLLVMSEIFTFGVAIAIKLLCAAYILIHAVAARRHWLSLRKAADTEREQKLPLPLRLCAAASQLACILIPIRFLLIPIMPVLIQALIVFASVLIFSRIRLWSVTADTRKQAKEMTIDV